MASALNSTSAVLLNRWFVELGWSYVRQQSVLYYCVDGQYRKELAWMRAAQLVALRHS